MSDAISMEDLQKMKVADLKKALKERNLNASGNKAELIERLQSSGESPGHSPVSQVLGETDAADEELDDAPDEELDDTPDEELDEDILGGDDEELEDLDLKDLTEDPVPEKENITIIEAVSPEKVADKESDSKPKLVKISVASDKDRETARAQRFGPVTNDAKKKSRAERFNIEAPESKKTTATNKDSTPISSVSPVDNTKLQKRAERFGTVVSSQTESLDKLKTRADRFGQVTSSELTKVDSQEKLQKRKERFGASVTSTTGPPEEQDKKRKRLDRFGSG